MNDKIRLNMHWEYFQICRENYKEYNLVEEEIDGHRLSHDEEHIKQLNISALYSRRERIVLLPIIFGAMCLEAFIYDYGAQYLSDAFVKKHLDKLELPSKFLIITKLVTGNEFPTDSQAYEGLVKLKTDRNKLIHFKSKTYSVMEMEKVEQWHHDMNLFLKKAMMNSYDTVLNVMSELDKLHDEKTNYYAAFEADAECNA